MLNISLFWSSVGLKNFKVVDELEKTWASRVVRLSILEIVEAARAIYKEVHAGHKTTSDLIEFCYYIGKKRKIIIAENGLVDAGASVVKGRYENFLICGIPLPMIFKLLT